MPAVISALQNTFLSKIHSFSVKSALLLLQNGNGRKGITKENKIKSIIVERNIGLWNIKHSPLPVNVTDMYLLHCLFQCWISNSKRSQIIRDLKERWLELQKYPKPGHFFKLKSNTNQGAHNGICSPTMDRSLESSICK